MVKKSAGNSDRIDRYKYNENTNANIEGRNKKAFIFKKIARQAGSFSTNTKSMDCMPASFPLKHTPDDPIRIDGNLSQSTKHLKKQTMILYLEQ